MYIDVGEGEKVERGRKGREKRRRKEKMEGGETDISS